ncbi:hypothetical protein CNY89_08855 [Amaricoccus sp. HAR-UPW-R2A-40]|nr:hypothetical protein CNY89_08855 [Amaricoccus sp. HAR-UPW-R2A-40]
MRKTATIQDVARLAGVSTATVSRVLSSPGVVAEASLTRLLPAADRTWWLLIGRSPWGWSARWPQRAGPARKCEAGDAAAARQGRPGGRLRLRGSRASRHGQRSRQGPRRR